MPAARPRRPGRRPVDDAADLRGRLLDAAIDAYSRTGVAASTNRAIARVAGVNPALVNYYFGDRLADAVVEERMLPAVAEVMAAMGEPPDDPLALASRFVDAVSAAIARHPWLPALWIREVLVEGGAFRDALFARIGPLPRAVAARFGDAQRAGRLDPALDPRLVVVSMVALTMFTAASAPIWRRLFEADDLDIDTVRRHAHAMLAHGLAPTGGSR